MKIEELYDILKADNFDGECVLKTCLKGPLKEGEITSKIATSYYSSMQILNERGIIYPDYIEIKDMTFYGFLKNNKNRSGKEMIYSIPVEDIKSFEITSGLDHEKYHRPVYFKINEGNK